MKNKGVRLSKNVVPERYHIELRPDLDNFTFSGIETIEIKVLRKTKIITLHAKEIEIDTVDADKMFATKISYSVKAETASFYFPKPISGKVKLTFAFRGILNDKMRGFYRSRYRVGEKDFHMATTQFEATDARRAFPSFDEPAQKAVFHVSLVVPKGKSAISNTLPVSVREHETGYQIVKFAPTPKMSTYLLAFIVGDFEYIEKKSSRGVIVRVHTTPGKSHQAKFALDTAVKVLGFYEKYFAIPYPLNTLDLVAIPDFASGAMENWGAVTYRESAILVDDKHSSLVNKQWVALVIAHELAHQWFGNLVTMEWWTHLWLNEGFASFIEYLAVDKIFPNWDIWTQFLTNDLGAALRLDALASTHPIEVEVHHPDEIGEIFDEVSYSKGASVIRMLAEYLGEKDFRDGLRYYLKKHSYKNTATMHLWQALEKVSGKPVAKMMHSWTSKPGYPVVKATLKNNKIKWSQERFFASPISKKKNKDRTKWVVPISYKRKSSWFKLNIGETGVYRSAYEKKFLEALIEPVRNKTLPPADRLGIIRDLFALSEAGVIPTTDALEFLKAYKNEDSYVVWAEIAMGLARIEQLLAKNNARERLGKLTVELFSPLARRIGWTKNRRESHTDTLLRSLAIARAGRAGDEKIVAEARMKFASLRKGKHVPPDIRSAVYSIVAKWGGNKDYSIFLERYKKETLHEEKNRIGNALGDFKDPKILEKVCSFSVSKYVRPQDTVGILSGVGVNPAGRDIWWNFVRQNWKMLVSRYGEGGLTLGRAVKAIGCSAEAKHFKSFKKFFAAHPAPGGKRAVEQVLERLESNIAWLRRDRKIIEKYLSSRLK